MAHEGRVMRDVGDADRVMGKMGKGDAVDYLA